MLAKKIQTLLHEKAKVIFASSILMFAFFAVPLATPQTAYAQSQPVTPGTGQTAGNQNNNEKGTSCAVEKVGWILCPILEQTAKMTDKLFQFLADHFLEVEPELLSDSSGTKKAWDQAIILANVMFVIAFLTVIYSQITGAGLSNYGIKRMLPRLILGAILVNLSFYICQALADLSNLLGYEIMTMLNRLLENQPAVVSMGGSPQTIDTQTGNGVLGQIVTAALPIAGFALLFVPGAGAVILAVLVICLVCIILLLLRKALIVLFVVISPFAFVAYLLPNTEKYFQKWLSGFWRLLVLFPVIALLMGGGLLASSIVLTAGINAGNTGSSDPSQCNSNSPDSQKIQSGGWSAGPCEASIKVGNNQQAGSLLVLVAVAIAVVPLAGVKRAVDGVGDVLGSAGSQVTAAIRSGTNGSVRGLGGALGRTQAGQAITQGIAGRRAGRAAYRQQRFVNNMSDTGARGWMTRRLAGGVTGNIGAAASAAAGSRLTGRRGAAAINAVTGGMQAENSRLLASVAGAQAKAEADEIKAEHTLVDRMDVLDENGNHGAAVNEAQALINGGNFDSPRLAALLEHIANVNKQAFMHLGSQLGTGNSTVASRAAAGVMAGMGGFYGGRQVARMQNGQIGAQRDANGNPTETLAGIAQQSIAGGGMSATNIASLSNDNMNTLRDLVATAHGQQDADGNDIGDLMRGHLDASERQLSRDQLGNMSAQKQNTFSGIIGRPMSNP